MALQCICKDWKYDQPTGAGPETTDRLKRPDTWVTQQRQWCVGPESHGCNSKFKQQPAVQRPHRREGCLLVTQGVTGLYLLPPPERSLISLSSAFYHSASLQLHPQI